MNMIKYKDNEQLKAELKAEMSRKGLKQKELANKMQVSAANLSNILVNKSSLTFSDVQRICNALDCTLYINIVDNSTDIETTEQEE